MKQITKLFENPFINLGFILAAVTVMVPLQRYMSLGRYQHYGMGLFIFGLGYTLHAIWTWSRQPFWNRACYSFTGAFFCSVGFLFFANPWLDWKTAVQTEERALLRALFLGIYLILGFLLLVVWLVAYVKSRESKRA